jgi:hypothetical protein
MEWSEGMYISTRAKVVAWGVTVLNSIGVRWCRFESCWIHSFLSNLVGKERDVPKTIGPHGNRGCNRAPLQVPVMGPKRSTYRTVTVRSKPGGVSSTSLTMIACVNVQEVNMSKWGHWTRFNQGFHMCDRVTRTPHHTLDCVATMW